MGDAGDDEFIVWKCKGRGGSIPNTQKKMDAFVPVVSELTGYYINLCVVLKFTLNTSEMVIFGGP